MRRLLKKFAHHSFYLLGMIIMGLIASCNHSTESEEDYKIVSISPDLTDAVKQFSTAREFHNGIAIVEKNGRYGFIDSLGNEVVKCNFIGLSYKEPGFYTTYVSNNGPSRMGLICPDGRRLTDDVYSDIKYFPDLNLICCYKQRPDRFFNLKGEEITPEIYHPAAVKKAEGYSEFSGATPFYNGVSFVKYYNRPSKTYFHKFIDTEGNIIMSVTEKGGKFGVSDLSGKEIVPHKYSSIDDYDSGYLLVSDGVNRQGLWDLKNGKETVAPEYNVYGRFGKEFDLIHTFIKNGFLTVSHSNRVKSLINPTDGTTIIGENVGATGFDLLSNDFIRGYFENGEFDYSYAIFDKDGKLLFDQYDYIDEAPQGFVVRSHKEENGKRVGKEGAFNLKGKNIVKVENYTCGKPSEGLVPVQHEENGKYGFVNGKGKSVIEPRYDYAGYFSEGLAPVMIDGKCGYVNRIGQDTFGNE